MRRLPLLLLLPLAFFLIHAAAVAVVAGGVYAGLGNGYRESVGLWAVPVVFDLPALPLLVAAEASARPMLEPKGDFVWRVVYPAVAHTLIGGAVWSVAGWCLAGLISWLRGRGSKQPD